MVILLFSISARISFRLAIHKLPDKPATYFMSGFRPIEIIIPKALSEQAHTAFVQ